MAQNLLDTPPAHAVPLLQRMGVAEAASPEALQLQKTVMLALTPAGVV